MRIVFKMAENAEAASEENICKKTGTKSKKDTNMRWKWDNTKTERILEVFKAYKRQKLGEGVEWDSDKVVLFEHGRSALAEQWPEDFGKSEPSTPEKPVEEMSKEEYQKHVENLKAEKELIALGYRRVSNRFKTLKKNYTQDCQNDVPLFWIRAADSTVLAFVPWIVGRECCNKTSRFWRIIYVFM